MPPSSIIRFLNLDLDAFLSDTAHWRTGRTRLPEQYSIPWTDERLIEFLEKQCLLNADKPIPGRLVEDHDAAFDYWKQLLSSSDSTLEVVHVDGHADLGMGELNWRHLVGEHLHLPLSARHSPIRDHEHCSAGSYLAYALASRWISNLAYTYPSGGGEDLIPIYFQDNDPESGFVELKSFTPAQIEEALRRLDFKGLNCSAAVTVEPRVPFTHTPIEAFQAALPFDYALLAQSPAFTPASSDGLIPIIARYIAFDDASFAPQ